MVLGLLMGCNNGLAELEKEKESILSISNLRQGFLDVFATFGSMVSDAFGIDAKTTKKAVGEHLGNVGEAVKTVKGKLEEIKGSEQYNSIKDKADGVINKAIETLSKIVEGTSKIKEATKEASGKIANSNAQEDAELAEEKSVQSLVEGISVICSVAKNADVALRGETKKVIENSQDIAKLFNDGASATDAALKGARRALIAASGADILAAIEAAKTGISKPSGNIQNATNAYDIALAAKNTTNARAGVNTNASAIAAGLALRAMANKGKLATHNSNAKADDVNAVLIGAVGKILNEIVSTIRKTVDKCLKDVSDCIKEDYSSSVVKSSKRIIISDGPELEKALKALKGIVDIAYGEGVEKLEEGKIAVQVGSSNNNKDV